MFYSKQKEDKWIIKKKFILRKIQQNINVMVCLPFGLLFFHIFCSGCKIVRNDEIKTVLNNCAQSWTVRYNI